MNTNGAAPTLDELAVQHAQWGIHVFPLRPGGKEPLLGGRGHLDASSDPIEVARARAGHPAANIGWAVSPSGLLVVDVDALGDEGAAALAEFTSAHGDGALPDTLQQRTASGKRHLIYRAPEGIEIARKIRVDGLPIDLLGDGYIVAPGSRINGSAYELVTPVKNVAEAPPALVELCRRDARARRNGGAPKPAPGERIPVGTRDEALFREGCKLARGGLRDERLEAALQGINRALCDPPCPEGDVAEKARNAQRAVERQEAPSRPAQPPWPEAMGEDAFHGIVGEWARAVEPTTEAAVEPILIGGLAWMGAIAGPGPHFMVGATKHPAIIHGAHVAATSRGRKGTSSDLAEDLAVAVDHTIRRGFGLSSGEGLIDWFLDDQDREEEDENAEIVPVDPRGVIDEREFASVLQVMRRDGNTLSPNLRNLWDGRPLGTMTRSRPVQVRDHHGVLLTAITHDELKRDLPATAITNGTANRFLWYVSQRSRRLPDPPPPVDVGPFAERLRQNLNAATHFAKRARRRTDAYRKLWGEVYDDLTTDHPGAFGAVTARAEAQVPRLALIYSLIDGCAEEVDEVHLRAALAVWKYCEESARHIFGKGTGDELADRILAALEHAGAQGLTREDIRSVVGGRVSGQRVTTALEKLRELGHAQRTSETTAGRTAERWRAR